MKLNEKFLEQMREATQLLQSGGPTAATAAIQRALQGDDASMHEYGPPNEEFIDINPPPAGKKSPDTVRAKLHAFTERWINVPDTTWDNPLEKQAFKETDSDADHQAKTPGRFLSATCTNPAGTRSYKIYIPSGYKGEPLPLIVMLHGCKQNPDDFAAGTKMNQVAEKNNCFVAYPAQIIGANSSNCWNWFKSADQKRNGPEPSIIADITRQVMRDYRVDPERVFIAGLSAGAAMAAIVASAYPELYAAVGIHSGLPIGSAHDVPSAFQAMKSSGKSTKRHTANHMVPAIVFHGDRDHTVHPDNGVSVLAQCMDTSVEAIHHGHMTLRSKVVKGKSEHGRSYTQTIYYNSAEVPIAEHWTVHGAGHAWSGGASKGSYTDPKGPDAAQEMYRFFAAHPNQQKTA